MRRIAKICICSCPCTPLPSRRVIHAPCDSIFSRRPRTCERLTLVDTHIDCRPCSQTLVRCLDEDLRAISTMSGQTGGLDVPSCPLCRFAMELAKSEGSAEQMIAAVRKMTLMAGQVRIVTSHQNREKEKTQGKSSWPWEWKRSTSPSDLKNLSHFHGSDR